MKRTARKASARTATRNGCLRKRCTSSFSSTGKSRRVWPLPSIRGLARIMVEIQPFQLEVDREEDGRILASIPQLPGVMAYGETEEMAVRKVKSIALQVLADMIERGEELLN